VSLHGGAAFTASSAQRVHSSIARQRWKARRRQASRTAPGTSPPGVPSPLACRFFH